MNLTLVDVLCPTCLFLILGSAVPGFVFALFRRQHIARLLAVVFSLLCFFLYAPASFLLTLSVISKLLGGEPGNLPMIQEVLLTLLCFLLPPGVYIGLCYATYALFRQLWGIEKNPS